MPKKKLTVAEYLAIEEAAAFKSEFYDGEMFPLHCAGPTGMAGASPNHNYVTANLTIEVGIRLKGRSCRVATADLRV